jgi:hypothetical protein
MDTVRLLCFAGMVDRVWTERTIIEVLSWDRRMLEVTKFEACQATDYEYDKRTQCIIHTIYIYEA